jgi:hypothetical protein
MTEEKTETLPQIQKPKSRPFYYIDGILIRLFLIVLIIALLWNWDGFWKTDVKFLNDAQKTYFPIKYEAEHLKTATLNDKAGIFHEISSEIIKCQQETQKAIKAQKAAEERAIAINKKADELLRYYDTSLRIIKQLKRKFSPDEIESVLKCNSIECENITSLSPEAEPGKFSFE